MLCWDNFLEYTNCNKHGKNCRGNRAERVTSANTNLQPKHHTIEGTEREEVPNKKKKKIMLINKN